MKTLMMIPAYNEAANIQRVVEDLIDNYPQYDYVVINDGSSDDTLDICRRCGFRVIDLPINLGIGGCIQTGYLYAKENQYDIAVQYDGDGQHDARFIAPLIAPIERGEADMVIGSRYIGKTGFQSSGARRLGNRLLAGIIRMTCGYLPSDTTSGFRAASRRMIEFFSKSYAQDYPEPEAIIMAVLHGYQVGEVPVEMNARQGGQSSIAGWKSLKYMVKVACAIFLYRIAAGRGEGA